MRRIDYDVKANWKAILENYQECYHCPGVHPQLNRITPYNSGHYLPSNGAAMNSYMEVLPQFETLSMTGAADGRDADAGMTEDDHNRDLLLRGLAQPAVQPASRLPDAALGHTAGAGPDAGALRVVLRSGGDGQT